jgi:tetratricopeptide (TPR) repeat protein
MRHCLAVIFVLGLLFGSAHGNAEEPAAGSHASSESLDPNAKVDALEKKMVVLESRVNAFQELIQLASNFVSIAVVVSAIIGGLLIRWQWMQQRRAQEFYEKLIKDQEDSKGQLSNSARMNIDGASALFSSLTDMLAIQTKAKELEETAEKREIRKRRDIILTLNSTGIEIRKTITRNDYTLIDRQEAIREFAQNWNWNQREHGIKDFELGAASMLVLGLDLRGSLNKRLEILEQAAKFGIRDQEGGPSDEIPREMTQDKFREWSRKCTNEAFHQLGILRYNLGKYQDAISAFEKALEQDAADLNSALYIPEAKFLGHLAKDFDVIVDGFTRVADEIFKGPRTQAWTPEDKNALLALTHVRWGNCYYAESDFDSYRKHRSLKEAHNHFQEATRLSPNSYLAQFSYAQSLSAWASQLPPGLRERDERTEEAVKIFAGVFPMIRQKLATTSEPKIQCMLYYMLAICAKEGRIPGQLPEAYLTQIFNEKGKLGVNPDLRIFSPRTKNDLSVDDYMREVEEYQRQLSNRD